MAGVVKNEEHLTPLKVNYKDILTTPKTEQIVISFNKSLNDSDLYEIIEDECLLDKLNNIDYLSLDFSSYSFLNDDSIIELIKNVPHVKSINLKSCTSLTDKSIIHIAEHCKTLESLDISWCNISSKSVYALADHKMPLKRINLRSCYITDECIEQLLQNCIEIKQLLLPWCKSLTNKTLQNILKFNPYIIAFDIRGNEKIEEISWINFFKQIQALKVLHLKRCKGITSSVIESLKHLHLQKLNLRGCGNNISNNTWMDFFDHPREIESIDLAWHDYLSDETIIQLSKSCAHLKSIDLSGCDKLTTHALVSFVEKCKNLEKIILFNNPKIIIPNNIKDKVIQF